MRFTSIRKLTLVAGCLLPLLACGAEPPENSGAHAPAVTYTPEQKAQFGEVVRDYLLNHPEVLIEAGQRLQAQQQKKQQDEMTEAVVQNQAALLNSPASPSYGPANAKVTVVEFFDYQCIYCAQLAPVLNKVIKANPDVRFVFKEWPIFAGRWKRSLTAAETGLRVWHQKGAAAYLKYHNALYATGDNEGRLTTEDIWKAAGSAGYRDPGKAGLAELRKALEENSELAQQIGFRGTPAVVVMPSADVTAGRITVIPGYPQGNVLQNAISRAAAPRN
ncbi:disulfide bond formation protein DsbA [Pantoea rodasii]|uniref:Disulfide bond formation protein DsbA n=1 Tax=Pantoea rodasii TaxID=1076549 RepID=A0A2M9WED0_9GAMM|nr:DsbA family protein [Pantoea rodasii]ORM59729.1 disulfide bond formation protein DsbA [Pantoea rodasii]PJZ05867.1 disulfide bond formation protein DsbA [Pantoea rodasii]